MTDPGCGFAFRSSRRINIPQSLPAPSTNSFHFPCLVLIKIKFYIVLYELVDSWKTKRHRSTCHRLKVLSQGPVNTLAEHYFVLKGRWKTRAGTVHRVITRWERRAFTERRTASLGPGKRSWQDKIMFPFVNTSLLYYRHCPVPPVLLLLYLQAYRMSNSGDKKGQLLN